MTTIILLGDKKDIQIKEILINILSKKYQLNLITDKCITTIGIGNVINLIDTDQVETIQAENCILIIKENIDILPLKFINNNTKIILNSSDTTCIKHFSDHLSFVFTCGFSSKDYITFSSKESTRAVVALQRSIKTIQGNKCEPFEIPCIINENQSDFSILASIMAMIFVGLINENNPLNNIPIDLTKLI